ncbi:MAG TPA: PKD domain-containing protein, partial [Planctomycetota bacterium]|nr:PKD domain-containing protein [Planctomycetota bacterium]
GTSVATASTASDASYVFASGTSFACPLAAGLCAMIWSANPALTPNQVEAMLKATCNDLGATGIDDNFGHGRINSLQAISAALGTNNPPAADFIGTPTSGIAPLMVQFTDQSTGNPTAWSWTFGDGGTSSAQSPSHTYAVAGTYTVAMTASNSAGGNTRTRVGYIVVAPQQQNQPPVVDAGPDRTITLPASASLDGTVSDDGLPNPPGAVTTTWSVVSGPGTVAFGNVNAIDTTASFSAAGTYVLRLTASDGALSANDSMQVIVNAGGGTEVVIAFDDLDSGTGSGGRGWADVWRGNGDVVITTRDRPNSPRWHLRMRSTGFAQRLVNLSGVSNAKLVFWAKLRSFENRDLAFVQVSTDGGVTFTTLRTFVNGEDDN